MNRLNEQELSVWRYFLKAHAKVIEQIERDLSAHKRVPLMTYDVLIVLFEAPEKKLQLKKLTEKLVLTKSGLTRLLDRLEKKGFIRREPSQTDRRSIFAVLTERGEKELRRAWPIYARGIKQYFSTFMSDEELKIMQRIFQSLYESENRDDDRADA